jgi:hypothetical protein
MPEEERDVVGDLIRRTKVNFSEPVGIEDMNASNFKLQTEVDVTQDQGDALEEYLPFYGRHVAINNLRRFDNLVHLDYFDTSVLYDRCPTLRHRSTRIKGRALSSLQMHRANPEVGGFERKAETTAINKLNYDISDGRTNNAPVVVKKEGRLSRAFRRK